MIQLYWFVQNAVFHRDADVTLVYTLKKRRNANPMLQPGPLSMYLAFSKTPYHML